MLINIKKQQMDLVNLKLIPYIKKYHIKIIKMVHDDQFSKKKLKTNNKYRSYI